MKHKRAITVVVVICVAAIAITGLFIAQFNIPRGASTERYCRIDESATNHPFSTISGSAAYDKATYVDLAPLMLEYEKVYVSICKGYAVHLPDGDLATILGLGLGGDPARRASFLYCENGTARVIYGTQYNAVSIIDYVFKVDGTWYMVWFASSYSYQMLHLLGIIARG